MAENNIKEEVLKDYAKDARGYVHLLKIIVICLCVVLSLLVAGIVVLEINHQNRMTEVANHASDKMVELLSQYDWEVEYEIESTGNDYYSGNIIVEK